MKDIASEFCGQTQPHGSHLWSTPQVYGLVSIVSVHQCAGTRLDTAAVRDFAWRASGLLLSKASARMVQSGPNDERGAATWDAGVWLHEQAIDEVAADEGSATQPQSDLPTDDMPTFADRMDELARRTKGRGRK